MGSSQKDLIIMFETILNKINIGFNRGEAVLIAGQNGSGKSTFLKCLAGVLFPDSGMIHFDKKNSKNRIGFISEDMSLIENYTLNEGINFHCGIFKISEFDDSLIRELNLTETKK